MNVLSVLGEAILSSPEAGAVIGFMLAIGLIGVVISAIGQIIDLWKHRGDDVTSSEKDAGEP